MQPHALVTLVLVVLVPALAQQRTDDRGVRRRCGQGEATCGDGRCIDYRRLCDGRADCVDGSDELDCGVNRCQPNELKCDNGKCIMKHWRCDGDDDCGDETDERNCEQRFPGSRCSETEYQCADRLQCIPRSFHCDGQNDCVDGSDERGCAAPVIVEQPPAVSVISIGGVFVIRCRAIGTPTPEISWRRNWRHVPDKCRQESLEGRGTLTCPDAAAEDQGAYSCEAINTQGVVFAVPDTNVVVTNGGICQPPEFNSAALTNADCQRCFCFGVTTECASSSLFVSEMPAPDPSGFSLHTLDVTSPRSDIGTLSLLRERPYPGRDGEIQVLVPQMFDSYAYFGLPSSHKGQLLNSYGGYLRFRLSPVSPADDGPEVIIQGNNITLWHRAGVKPTSGNYIIRIGEGSFYSSPFYARSSPQLASRDQIMMALQNVDNLFIRAPAVFPFGPNTVLSGVRLDTAVRSQTPQGPAAMVEQCSCPAGYTGNSCEECAPGYERVPSSDRLSLGTCESRRPTPPPAPQRCRDGEYGDPSRGIACRPCPCPGGQQQNGRTCFLDSDNQVTCNCDRGYGGRRCERCADGYRGDPGRGEPCRPGGECDRAGSLEEDPDPRTGRCNCKEFVTGSRCDQCVQRAFFLSPLNQYGCINCFCSGVTDQCTSSQWYRQQETAVFVTDTQGINLSDDLVEQTFEGVSLDRRDQQLVFKDLDRLGDKPAYWSLPARFLGDKVTAYGGYLRINMSFTAPAGAQPFPDYPDVEIFGNDVRLGHLVSGGMAAGYPISLSVPLLETAWRRDDGGPVDREHLLIALADLEYIIFKAADARGASEARLSGVELDTATQRFTGQEPAYAVEQCSCPQGYRGLSCEDCDVGYTRSLSGLYLRTCVQCNCGGRSDECDPETGECLNCRENTDGPECGVCRAGYDGDPARGVPCRPRADLPCDCDRRGSASDTCDARRQCDCKTNVEGNHCDRCRAGTFGLGTDPEAGCSACFCSDVSRQCSVARLYRSQLPMSVLGSQHGVTLANSKGVTVVENGDISFSAADNEVSYRVSSSRDSQTLYWALPDLFTGDQLKSYGGSLMVRQRLQLLRPGVAAQPDTEPDIILYGGAVELRLRTPNRPRPDGRPYTYSVRLSPDEGWVDGNTGARADRALLMTALGDVEAILIRATVRVDGAEQITYLSNAVLDTAIATTTQDGMVDTIEQCRCPPEYEGLSCQDCAPGHYRAVADDTCRRCPCGGNEVSCEVGETGDVVCNCRPNFSGRRCEIAGAQSPGGGRGDQSSSGGRSRDQSTSDRSRGGDQSRDDTSRGDQSRGDTSRDDQSRVDTAGSGGRGEPLTAPRVTISPRYLQLEAGQPAELRCEATGNPPPVLSWSGGRDGLLEPDVTVVDGLFAIGAVSKAHESEYTCTATNAAGTDSVRTIIYVSEPAPPPTERRDERRDDRRDERRDDRRDDRRDERLRDNRRDDRRDDRRDQSGARFQGGGGGGGGQRLQVSVFPSREQQAQAGQSAFIQCRPVEGSPRPRSTVWTRADGRPMPDNAQFSTEDGTLRFTNVTAAESGDYICTATDGVTQATASTRLYVQSLVAPVIRLSHPEIYRVTEGDRVELTCSAYGDPAPSVFWSANRWTEQSGVVGRSTGVIASVTPSDAGVFTCTASNSAGTTEQRLQLVVEPLGVSGGSGGSRQAASGRPAEFVPPPPLQPPAAGSVRTDRPLYVVPMNGRAELTCLVEGASSRVALTWIRAGGLSMPVDHSIRAGTLYINAVQKEAEGVYTCLGIGGSGVVLFRADAMLRVMEPPRIQLSPVRQVVQPGESASIQCRTTGDPPIEVAWSRLQQSLPATAYIENGNLLFSSISESDAGRYICLAENLAGRSEGIAEVIVRRGASIVAFERDVRAYLGSTITLRCDSSGFDGRISWARRPDVPLPDTAVADDTSLTLTKVDETAAGEYVCSVRDREGRTYEDTIILTVEPAPAEALTQACPPTTLPCGSGECLPFKYFCNGINDCIDGSDESQCSVQSDQPAN